MGGTGCAACQSPSSCAGWSPSNLNGPDFCPPPNKNNLQSVWDTCTWKKTVTLRYPQYSVFRCYDVSQRTQLAIRWKLRGQTNQAKVLILDYVGFVDFTAGKQYYCMNNCSSNEPSGEVYRSSGWYTDYYVVTLGLDKAREQTISIQASVKENL